MCVRSHADQQCAQAPLRHGVLDPAFLCIASTLSSLVHFLLLYFKNTCFLVGSDTCVLYKTPAFWWALASVSAGLGSCFIVSLLLYLNVKLSCKVRRLLHAVHVCSYLWAVHF
jgi:hypothetical protein